MLLSFITLNTTGFTQDTLQHKQSRIFGEFLGRSAIASINFERQFSKHFAYQTGIGYSHHYYSDMINFSLAFTAILGKKHQMVSSVYGVVNYNLYPYPKTKQERKEQIKNEPYDKGVPAIGYLDIYYYGILAGYRYNWKNMFIQLSPFLSYAYHLKYNRNMGKWFFISLSIGYKLN